MRSDTLFLQTVNVSATDRRFHHDLIANSAVKVLLALMQHAKQCRTGTQLSRDVFAHIMNFRTYSFTPYHPAYCVWRFLRERCGHGAGWGHVEGGGAHKFRRDLHGFLDSDSPLILPEVTANFLRSCCVTQICAVFAHFVVFGPCIAPDFFTLSGHAATPNLFRVSFPSRMVQFVSGALLKRS